MLARSFLRLCALEALRPSALLTAESPAWPTLAAQYVSDSRIDPIDDLSADERRPLIAVYTEDAQLTKIAQSGPQFYKGEVDLVFELSVVQQFSGTGPDADPVVDYADTDAALEAQLDAMEDQMFFCLHFGPTGRLFRQMAKLPFTEWTSNVHRSGEEAIRMARRIVRGRIMMKEACYVALPEATPSGLARLPPALQSIAEQLDESTYLADLALGLARAASVMPNRQPLNTVGLTVTRQPVVDGVQPIEAKAANLQGET